MNRYLLPDLVAALAEGDSLHVSAAAALHSLSVELTEARHRSSTKLGARVLEAVEGAVLEHAPGVSVHSLRKECVATVVNVQTRSGETYQNRGALETKAPPCVIIDVRLTVSDPDTEYTAEAGEAREDVRK